MQLPNIVFLFPDQLRFDFLSAYGSTFIDTPNIDSIARNGVKYQNAYSASPLCVPARTSLLLGINAIKHGVTDNFHFLRPNYQSAGFSTWPEILSATGYKTAAMGKMHFYPWDSSLGFQHRVIAEDKRWPYIKDDYAEFLESSGYRKYRGDEHEGYHENKGAITSLLPWSHSVDHFVGQAACRFIEMHDTDKPFAMMVGFPGPHCPYDPAEDFDFKYDPNDMPDSIPAVPMNTPSIREANINQNKQPWNGVDYSDFPEWSKKKIRAHYATLVKQIDYEVGQIIQSLETKGILDNTLIIFASDHGDWLGDHDLIGKGAFYEGAIRIPLMISGPGFESGKSEPALVELRDITATILSASGSEIPAYFDSNSLYGVKEGSGRDRIFGMLRHGWMNFDGRWKLHKYNTGDYALFDMQSDPNEQINLIGHSENSPVLARLESELAAEVMASINLSMHDRLQSVGSDGPGLVNQPEFGARGWVRPDLVSIKDMGPGVQGRAT